jgi:hypothetical protein
MHEAPETVFNGDTSRTDATRLTRSDLRFHQNPLTAADRSTSWHQWQLL